MRCFTLLCLAPAHALKRLTSASLPKLPNRFSTSLASAVGGTLAKKICMDITTYMMCIRTRPGRPIEACLHTCPSCNKA